MRDERSSNIQAMRPGPAVTTAPSRAFSQTWLDGLAVLLGLAVMTSAYLGWMSASHAQNNDCDVAVQARD